MEKRSMLDYSFVGQVGKKSNQSESHCDGRLIYAEAAELLKKKRGADATAKQMQSLVRRTLRLKDFRLLKND